MDTDSSSFAPPHVKMVSGLVLLNNFVPSRRFREDGQEASQLATVGGGSILTYFRLLSHLSNATAGGGGEKKGYWRGAPVVANLTKPHDPVQVQVARGTYIPSEKINNSDLGDDTLHVQAQENIILSRPQIPFVACPFYLKSECKCLWLELNRYT